MVNGEKGVLTNDPTTLGVGDRPARLSAWIFVRAVSRERRVEREGLLSTHQQCAIRCHWGQRRTDPICAVVVGVGEQEGELPNSHIVKSMKFSIKPSANSGFREP